MLLGSSLLPGLGIWVVLAPVGLIVVELKIQLEERLLMATFGDEYARYRDSVPQLVPGLRGKPQPARLNRRRRQPPAG